MHLSIFPLLFAVCRCHPGGCSLMAAAMLSWSSRHPCDSVCFMRFVGTVLENQGGAHRRRWVSMYCVCPVLKFLSCFPLARLLCHCVDVWWSDFGTGICGSMAYSGMKSNRRCGGSHGCAVNPSLSCNFWQPWRDIGTKRWFNQGSFGHIFFFSATPVRTDDKLGLWDIVKNS